MLLRINFSQQHPRKCRYIFAAPSDAITVVHPGEIYAVNRPRLWKRIDRDWLAIFERASLPMMAAPFPPAAAAGPLPRRHWWRSRYTALPCRRHHIWVRDGQIGGIARPNCYLASASCGVPSLRYVGADGVGFFWAGSSLARSFFTSRCSEIDNAVKLLYAVPTRRVSRRNDRHHNGEGSRVLFSSLRAASGSAPEADAVASDWKRRQARSGSSWVSNVMCTWPRLRPARSRLAPGTGLGQ